MGGGPLPVISIIIDDLGQHPVLGRAAIDLPGPVALSFLPHTPHARQLARDGHARGKEILLHLPMEAESGRALGPGGLTGDMAREAFVRVLHEDLAAIPHVIGVNNHMGSALTRRQRPMDWLMGELARRGGLFFVDSRTTARTRALRTARHNGVPGTRRDVFLDNDPDPAAIHRQLERLVRIARRKGSALAIGHPYRHTMEILAQWIPRAAEHGVRLVPVSRLVAMRERRRQTWQAFWYPSPKASRNSRP